MIPRMEFDLGEDGQSFEVNVLELARRYEGQYFPDTQPIDMGEFVESLEGPSCFVPSKDAIYVQQSFSPFLKLCSILVLHELIHSKYCRACFTIQLDCVLQEEGWKKGDIATQVSGLSKEMIGASNGANLSPVSPPHTRFCRR
jgi:hypothetical protein